MKREFLDLIDMTKRDRLIPPRRLRVLVGPAKDFEKAGQETLGMLISKGNLQPDDKILDVGCGCGRIALCLTSYMSYKGQYYGFDVSRKCVDWDIKHISKVYPNFHFQFSDIHNTIYNSKGKVKPTQYKFPFEDETFDVVVASSLLTHLLPADMEHYLSEISRVLKRKGKSVITYFLINRESRLLIDSRQSQFQFADSGKGYYAADLHRPEAALAYNEEKIRLLHKNCNLPISETYYGDWCGRKEAFSCQDFVIATRE